MSFYVTTHLGSPLRVWIPSADWKKALKIEHILDADIEVGLSRRENRRPRFEAMRLIQTHQLLLAQSEARAVFTTLMQNRGDFIGVPIYADAGSWEDWSDRIYNGQYAISYGDTGYAIYETGNIPSSLTHEYLAPMLVGRLSDRPKVNILSPEVCELTVKIIEQSPWEDRIGVMPEVAGSDWPDDLTPNWIDSPVQSVDDIVEFDSVGSSRSVGVEGLEGINNWTQQMRFTMDRSKVRTLLNFWLGRQGAVQSFVMPVAFQPDDTPTLELPSSTTVRFEDRGLVIDYSAPTVAETEIQFVQLPWEIEGVEGETPAQPAVAWLYRFFLEVPGGAEEWLFTSYERAITVSTGAVYQPALMAHDTIEKSIDLGDNPVRLQSWVFDNNPLVEVIQGNIDVPLQVQISQIDPADPSASAVLQYWGSVDRVIADGRSLRADTQLLGGSLESKVPRFRLGKNCNHVFCSAACGRSDKLWTFTGVVIAQVDKVVRCRLLSNPAGATIDTDYFAKGQIKKGTGESYEWRQIIRSRVVGSTLELTLKKGFRAVAEGLQVTILPHCSGTWAECRTKYNRTNEWLCFGGHPHIQSRNPSLPRRNINNGQGGKK